MVGPTLEERANFHQTSPSHGDSLWLWLVVSCVTLMTSHLIRTGSKVIQEGVWTNQEPESRYEPLSVPHLCPGHKGRALPGIPGHHCHGDPQGPAAPSAGDSVPGSGLIKGITSRGTWAYLGEPLLLTIHRPPQS